MHVTSLTARFMRRAQVQAYEPAEAEITIAVGADEGEVISLEGKTLDEVLMSLANYAKEGTYFTLGKPVPPAVGSVVTTPAKGSQPAAEARQPVVVPLAATSTPAATNTKNKGGRPTKAEVAARELAKTAPPPSPPPPAGSDAVDFGDTPVASSTGPIPAKVAPVAQTVAPKATVATPTITNNKQLVAWIGVLNKDGSITPSQVKELYGKYKIARVSDLPDDKTAAFVADIGLAINKGKESSIDIG